MISALFHHHSTASPPVTIAPSSPTIITAQRLVEAAGGRVEKLASTRETPPGRRPYWVRQYRVRLPGLEPRRMDERAMTAVAILRPVGSALVDLVRKVPAEG